MALAFRYRILWPALVALIATILLFAWRQFPWPLALFSGASIGALAYFSVSAALRLREEFRPRL